MATDTPAEAYIIAWVVFLVIVYMAVVAIGVTVAAVVL